MRIKGDGTPDYRRPQYWGYDTGRRTLAVECCGKELLSQVAYEQHMKTKHPKRVREMKKSGKWQQDLIDGWSRVKRVGHNEKSEGGK